METQMLPFFLLLCSSLLTGNHVVQGSFQPHHHPRHRHLFPFRPDKLFVFGDSYADTGNNQIALSNSWKVPYGITFPGKPAGRFSDGRVLTDYLAKFVGVKSPIPYKWRKVGTKQLKYGMNFAYGGTGVFDTIPGEPNMTTQIGYFQRLIKDSVYTCKDLQSSVALVTLSGNDYSAYLEKNGSIEGMPSLIRQVVNQLTVNLKRIHGLGVRKIAVTSLQPLGCLPRSTIKSSFQHCNGTENTLVTYHNILLQQAVSDLNNATKDSAFATLDLFAPFMSVLNNTGDSRFENPLRPCCVGVSHGGYCGSVDGTGAKLYTVCKDPDRAFFWDMVHPTQAGWHAIYSALGASLEQLY